MLILGLIFLTSISSAEDSGIRILDMKTAQGISEKYEPIKPSNTFPKGTSKVFCWFAWKDNEKKSPVTAKWTYLTDDIPVLSYSVPISRVSGSAGTSFAMPAGKTLPPGEYEVELQVDQKTLRSTRFTVADK